MSMALILLGTALLAIALAWRPASLHTTAISAAAWLLVLTLTCPIPTAMLIGLWLSLAALSLLWRWPTLRRYLCRRAHGRLNLERPPAPSLAGWEAELPSGSPNWATLISIGPPEISAAEQTFLERTVTRWCEAWRNQEQALDAQHIAGLAAAGVFGMNQAQAHGGLGFSASAIQAILSRLAETPTGAALAELIAQLTGDGPLAWLREFGNPQQTAWLADLASGRSLACWSHADDAARPQATVYHDATLGLALSVTFSHRHVHLAPLATWVGLVVELRDPDALLPEGHAGPSCLLVPAAHCQISADNDGKQGASPLPTGRCAANGLQLSLEHVIGTPGHAGEILARCQAVSGGQGCAVAAGRWQARTPPAEHGEVLAAAASITFASQLAAALARHCAWACDLGQVPRAGAGLARALIRSLAAEIMPAVAARTSQGGDSPIHPTQLLPEYAALYHAGPASIEAATRAHWARLAALWARALVYRCGGRSLAPAPDTNHPMAFRSLSHQAALLGLLTRLCLRRPGAKSTGFSAALSRAWRWQLAQAAMLQTRAFTGSGQPDQSQAEHSLRLAAARSFAALGDTARALPMGLARLALSLLIPRPRPPTSSP